MASNALNDITYILPYYIMLVRLKILILTMRTEKSIGKMSYNGNNLFPQNIQDILT